MLRPPARHPVPPRPAGKRRQDGAAPARTVSKVRGPRPGCSVSRTGVGQAVPVPRHRRQGLGQAGADPHGPLRAVSPQRGPAPSRPPASGSSFYGLHGAAFPLLLPHFLQRKSYRLVRRTRRWRRGARMMEQSEDNRNDQKRRQRRRQPILSRGQSRGGFCLGPVGTGVPQDASVLDVRPLGRRNLPLPTHRG